VISYGHVGGPDVLANARHIANPYYRNNPGAALSFSVTSLQQRLAFIRAGRGACWRFLDKGIPVCDNQFELWEAGVASMGETGE